MDDVICKKTFLKPLHFWFASSSGDLIKTFEVFCPSFLNFHDNSLAIPIYFLHSLELKQRQEVWVKAWLRPEADTSVTCWRDAAELFPIHLAYAQVSELFKKDTVKTSLSTPIFFIVNKFKASRQYNTEETYILWGKKLYLLINNELNACNSVIFCNVEAEIKA